MSSWNTKRAFLSLATALFTIGFGPLAIIVSAQADPPDPVRGVYLTSASFGERKVQETIHYAKHTGMNAVVLHVKDPYGHIHWESAVPVAREIGAFEGNGRLLKAIKLLRDADTRVIAKLDLFQDTLLTEKKPDWALLDSKTGKPWLNKRKLAWSNPCDKRVWAYNVALAKELVKLGVDEIQFDYIRFPSDGDLSRLDFEKVLQGASKIDTIGAFLEFAHGELKPLGVTISVDLFGFVAWKTDDFGVGQRMEEIAPHVDVVCPMLYPSHFPTGFLGMKDPSDHPREIMERSVAELLKRTKTEIRPWIQGFWYTPEEVNAQLDGVDATGVKGWLMWSPSSNYDVTYEALAKRLDVTLPAPKLYPDLAELAKREPREVRGLARLVHFTDYAQGYSVLSLEGAVDGKTSRYNNPTAIVQTLDEAVMDRILQQRGIPFDTRTGNATKTARLVTLLSKDLNVSVTRMRVHPIYIEWDGDCRFTKERREAFTKAEENPVKEQETEKAVEKAQPKKGKTVDPPLSQGLPAAYAQLAKFGAIEWTVKHVPWVSEGPEAGISGMGMVHHDGNIYLCGGFIPGGDGSGDEASHRTSRWTWRYDPANDTWEQLANAPVRREYVRSIAANDAVYLIGGGCQHKGQEPPYRVHGDTCRLDLTEEPPVWNTLAPLNVPRTHTAVGHAANFFIVAGGNEYDFAQEGYSHATIRDTTEVFDLTNQDGGWLQRAPVPSPARGWTGSVVAKDKLYIFGGLTWTESNEPVGTQETLRYDPAADAWEKRTPPPLAISAWEGALYAQRYAILVGGVERRHDPAGNAIVWSDLVWAYDTQEDRWFQVDGRLPPGAVFNDPGVVIVGNTIYVAGAEGPYGSHYDYFLVGEIEPAP